MGRHGGTIEAQVSRRPVQQAHTELILELRYAPADRRDRHAEPTRRLGKALGFDDLRKDYQGIEVHRRLPNFGKLNPGFAV